MEAERDSEDDKQKRRDKFNRKKREKDSNEAAEAGRRDRHKPRRKRWDVDEFLDSEAELEDM